MKIGKKNEILWMSNQVSIHPTIFDNKHPCWIFGFHDLRIFSKWLVQSKDFGDFIITLVPNHLNLNEILNEPKSENTPLD